VVESSLNKKKKNKGIFSHMFLPTEVHMQTPLLLGDADKSLVASGINKSSTNQQ